MWIQKMRYSSVEILTRKFKTIHVLRDSGQTHKFIQERVAIQLGLIVITTKELNISSRIGIHSLVKRNAYHIRCSYKSMTSVLIVLSLIMELSCTGYATVVTIRPYVDRLKTP